MTNNVGPSDALGVRVTDNKPAQIASWTWTCTTVTNASGCNGVTNSTNNFTDTVNIRVGGRIVYTVTANPANMPPNPLNLSNTARIILPGSPSSIDPNLANNSSTDINIPYIDLQVTKDDGVTTYIPGGTVTYTVTATNNSTFNLTGITVSDPIPDLVTTWSWACASGCTPVTNSSNDFSDTINLPANSSLVYTVTANISGTAGATNLTNTATVGVPAGLVDAVPANNTATDIDGPNIDSIDLQITKTDVPAGNTYTPGGQVRYEVVVTNNSAVNLTGVTVMDNIPPLIDPFSWFWTCAPGPGASCTQGIGLTHLYDTAVSLPPGGSVTYTINATVESFAIGTLENTATVIEPAGFVDAVPGNNTATDINVSLAAEPDIGPPDGDWTTPSEPGSLTFFLNPAIVADGDGNPDFVYYERQASAVRVDLDWVQIEISSDGNVWYQVFYWGDSDPGIPDTNTNMDYVNSINDLCTFEEDNCSIPLGRMYKNSGVTIDVDGIVPQGNYPWIRISSPIVSPDGDAPEVDAIQPYYP
jgi:uncharacterized repeat protein (TIGR01451 family)